MHDFQADDELYFCAVGDQPVEVLATARSKVTHKDEPMAFAIESGKGRVFHTPLCHESKPSRWPAWPSCFSAVVYGPPAGSRSTVAPQN
jgi:type 1 glutamine amidotransferase